MVRNRWGIAGFCLLSFLFTTTGTSLAASNTYFSAYITQAWMRPIKNEPRGVDQKGTFDATSYSLNMRFGASDTLTLATELHAKSWALLGSGSDTSLEPRLQVAAGSWRLSDSLRLSAGIQRAPLGIYGEVRDLGISVQSFMPILYLPATGFAPEAYRGIGLACDREVGPLAIEAQVFFGEIQTPAYEAAPVSAVKWLLFGGDYRDLAMQRLRNTVGGRINLSLWDETLLVSGGGYSGHNYDGIKDDQETNSWIIGGKLERWGLQLRTEYAKWNRNAPILNGALTTWYLYGSWKSPWDITLYANWDNTLIDDKIVKGDSIEDVASQVGVELLEEFTPEQIPLLLEIITSDLNTDQNMLTVGLDWRPSPELSIKLEDYMMRGLVLVTDLNTYDEFAHTLVVSVSYTFQ